MGVYQCTFVYSVHIAYVYSVWAYTQASVPVWACIRAPLHVVCLYGCVSVHPLWVCISVWACISVSLYARMGVFQCTQLVIFSCTH
jgi:predicted acyltransferase